MKRAILIVRSIVTILIVMSSVVNVFSQSTTNTGTEFYTAYMDHNNGASSNGKGTDGGSLMSLYITSTLNTSGTVTIADGSFAPISFNVTANQVTIVTIPPAAFLPLSGVFNKGLHIVTLKPVAIYAHIYANAVSGATLLLPVSTLGKDYFSINYIQNSNASKLTPAYSAFIVIATEDNTTVKVTPSAALIDGHAAGQTFTLSLSKGQLYQGLSATDLTGSTITSVNSATGGCTKIAVFSGSSRIEIGCNPKYITSDNLFQQVYPTASWGKTYITVPLANRNYDSFRIMLSNPSTSTDPNVKLNGVAVPLSSFSAGFYQFSSQTPNIITSDQPIQVVQYSVTEDNTINCGAFLTDLGDPEMIFLNPLEQTLNQVTLYSTGNYQIERSYINVVIKTAAVPSFTLDGASYTNFLPVPGNSLYSYAQIPVQSGPQDVQVSSGSQGTHTISANSGFNAIAYGFGSYESYGYAAGANLLNLNENITLANPTNDTLTLTNACVGVNYKLQLTLPYQTSNIVWNLKNGTTFTDSSPVPAFTVTKGTQTLYAYQYNKPIVYYTPGDTSVVATVFNPTAGACGNNDVVEFDFNVSAPPVANFSASGTCLGDSTVFTDKSNVTPSAVKTWLWNFGDNTTSSLKNPKHLYTSPGNYKVMLTVTNQGGCFTDTVQNVFISHLPVASFTTSTPDCAGQALTFTDNSTSVDSNIKQWIWTFGDGKTDTLTTSKPFTHTYAKAGNDTVKLSVINNNGCISKPFSQIISIHPGPVVNFGAPNVCTAVPELFTDSTTIADNTNSGFTYLWNFGDPNAATANPNTSTIQNPSHIYTQPGTYSVTLAVTSSNGCTVTKTKGLTVYALPVAAFSVADSTCLSSPTTFSDQSAVNNGTVNAWLWDFGDGSIATVQNPVHTYAAIGNYTVQLTATNTNGCASLKATKVIHISPLPVAAFSYSTPDCQTNAITFTDKSSTAENSITTWTWDFGDGNKTTVTNKQPFQHIYAAAGTYPVNLAVTTAQGCTASITQNIVVSPLPVVNFLLPDVCTNDTYAQFTDQSTIADKTESGFTYLWDFGDPNANAANPNTSTLQNPKHSYHAAAVYTVTLTVTSKNGCVVSKSQPFTVNGDTPIASFHPDSQNDYCSMNDVVFDNTSTVNFGSITKLVWFFDFANNPADSVVYLKANFPTNNKFSHNYGLFNSPLTKTYTVVLHAYSGGSSCLSTTQSTITVMANPVVNISQIGPICLGSAPVQITQNTNGFIGTGVFSGKGVSSSGLFDPSVSGKGTFTLNYTFTAQNGCSFSTSEQVVVNPVPIVNLTPNLTVLQGGEITLPATAAGDSLSYKWTPSIGLDHDNVLNPKSSPSDDITYTLVATNPQGCTAATSVNVTVLKAPVVPNAFTPNGDGVNDTWDIKYLNSYPNNTVEVYNRYGEKVFSSIGYGVPWDGTYHGSQLPSGVYYYIINPKNGRSIIAGYVTILR